MNAEKASFFFVWVTEALAASNVSSGRRTGSGSGVLLVAPLNLDSKMTGNGSDVMDSETCGNSSKKFWDIRGRGM